MKTPAFWYQPRGLAAYLLMPLGLFYLLGGVVRRALATPYHAKVPVICVGNIVAGGPGKTPTALALGQMLQQAGQRPVFVTRGYSGRERGPLRVDPARHASRDVGDEALLLARVAPVWIGRDRAAAIRQAEKEGTHIILDDGLQNPSVWPDLALLVVDAAAGVGNGCLIPAGPLRETYEEAMRRITAVVLIGERDEQRLAQRVQCPLLRAHYEPRLPEGFPRGRGFFAFTGIGRPQKFYATCRAAGLTLAATQDFADHHFFTARELAALRQRADSEGLQLLTTEKDWMRLPSDFRARVVTLPIALVFEDPAAVRQLLKI